MHMKCKSENRSICEELTPPSVLSPLPETIIKPKESGGNRQLEKDEKETLNRRMIYFILEAFGYPSDDILFVLRFDEQNAFLTK
jgi:hypothetical protein